MGTDSHTSEPQLEYRVRWGNVLLAAVALCGIVAVLLAPSTPDAAPIADAPTPSPRSGPTSLVSEIEPPRRRSRPASGRKPAIKRNRASKQAASGGTKRPATTDRRVTSPVVPTSPQPAAPRDPVASEFGL